MSDHRTFAFEAYDEWPHKPQKKIGENLLVLDVGARDDQCRERLEDRGYKWEGLDIEPSEDKKITRGRMEDMPASIKENNYDLMFACHSFEHCERPVDALREFMLRLKKGGKIFLALPEPNKHFILESDDDHIMCLNEMQLERLLKYAGYQQILVWESERPFNKGVYKTIVATGRKP